MTAFQAYAAGFGMILLDPATMAAAGLVWCRLVGIRRGLGAKGTPTAFGGGTAKSDVRQNCIGSRGVRRGAKGANQ